ncbi:MAG: hypothetical protein Q4C70_05525 [Planctomycetia bacterium]|nr:hypothetical protein [Planctomycetia bacterium]
MNVLGIYRSGSYLLGTFAFLSLTFVMDAMAANPTSSSSVMVPSTESETIVEEVPVTQNTVPYTGNTQIICCECDPCAKPDRRTSLRENKSALTCFNCRTNGSYKFPVPRQYTYFWPGIYSQQTMTEYVAPYQNLKLRSPSEVFDTEADLGQ